MKIYIPFILIMIINIIYSLNVHYASSNDLKTDNDPRSIIENFDITYINLPMNGENDNFSYFKIPSSKPWDEKDIDVKTIWHKLRFNPKTMLVHTGDFTYSTSTGHVSYLKFTNPSNIPFASAFGCENINVADSKARIDLRGTNFAVDDIFISDGDNPAGSVYTSYNNQVININGGGKCGYTIPYKASKAGGNNIYTGGWFLRLKHIETSTFIDPNNGFTYIKLFKTSDTDNYSMFKIPPSNPWKSTDKDVYTYWYSLRYDPKSGLVNTGDFTYTRSIGYVSIAENVFNNRIAYGSAHGCKGEYTWDATGKIDLTGTPFIIDDSWNLYGTNPQGSIVFSENKKEAVIKGGGGCGGCGPIKSLNVNQYSKYLGGFYLKLKRTGKFN